MKIVRKQIENSIASAAAAAAAATTGSDVSGSGTDAGGDGSSDVSGSLTPVSLCSYHVFSRHNNTSPSLLHFISQMDNPR